MADTVIGPNSTVRMGTGRSVPALNTAKYEGVNFMLSEEHASAIGRKKKLVEFPMSGYRVVQDLGHLPPIFKIKAIIYSVPGSRKDYITLTNEFLAALNKPGRGVLVLPHFGSMRATPIDYSVLYSHKQLGIGEVTVTFASFQNEQNPSRTITTSDIHTSCLQTLSQYIQRIETPDVESNLSNYGPLDKFKSTNITNVWGDSLSDINDVLGKVTTFQTSVTGIMTQVQTGITTLALAPIRLITDVIYGIAGLRNGVVSTISGIYTAWGEFDIIDFLGDSINNLFSSPFGPDGGPDVYRDIDPITGLEEANTADRRQIDETVLLANSLKTIVTMQLLVASIADKQYTTTESVDQDIASLYAIYNNVLEWTRGPLSDPDIKNDLTQQRTMIISRLEQKRENTYSLAQIQSSGMTAGALAFALYGEELGDSDTWEETMDKLIELNPNASPLEMPDISNVMEI